MSLVDLFHSQFYPAVFTSNLTFNSNNMQEIFPRHLLKKGGTLKNV